jgi:hypothetical protein
MSAGDLVSIDDVKAYLGGDLQSNDDSVLTRLITAASAFFTTACGNPILARSYVELYDGKGSTRLYLRNTPVIAVTSVAIDEVPIPASIAVADPGWVQNGNVIILFGYWFSRGYANVAVSYQAGYAATPADVAEAVIELVGLRYRGKDRLGKASESMGGIATTSYTQKDVSPFVQSVITRYMRANLA